MRAIGFTVGHLIAIDVKQGNLIIDELVTSACLPSGVNTACETMPPISMVSITLTSVPLIDSTLTDLSARLVTRARLPSALKLKPEGCLPRMRELRVSAD